MKRSSSWSREGKPERGGSGLEEEAKDHGHIPKNEGACKTKKLQAEVKTMQEEKQARQAKLEPFQQQAEGMID
jgi:hypothetical protein